MLQLTTWPRIEYKGLSPRVVATASTGSAESAPLKEAELQNEDSTAPLPTKAPAAVEGEPRLTSFNMWIGDSSLVDADKSTRIRSGSDVEKIATERDGVALVYLVSFHSHHPSFLKVFAAAIAIRRLRSFHSGDVVDLALRLSAGRDRKAVQDGRCEQVFYLSARAS